MLSLLCSARLCGRSVSLHLGLVLMCCPVWPIRLYGLIKNLKYVPVHFDSCGSRNV